MGEKFGALATASTLLAVTGGFFLGMPRGLVLGVVCIAVGAAGAVATAAVAWRLWRTGRWQKTERTSPQLTRDRVVRWTAAYLGNVFILSCVFTAGRLVESLVFGRDEGWLILVFAAVGVASGGLWLILRRVTPREARRDAV